MKNIITRSITGLVFVVIMIAAVLFNTYTVTFIFSTIILFSSLEYQKIVFTGKNISFPAWFPVYHLLIFLLSIFKPVFHNEIQLLPFIPVLITLPFLYELFKLRSNPLLNISLFLLPVFYISLPFTLLVSGSFQPEYNGKIILAFFSLIWANDTFAYIFGISLGKHRLYEKVSPKKSWEGFVGGSISTLIFGYFIPHIFKIDTFHYSFWILAALVVSVSGTLGDLVESLIKRSVNIKDSGNLLPGHGGFLDRFDAALIAAPFFAALIYLFKYILP